MTLTADSPIDELLQAAKQARQDAADYCADYGAEVEAAYQAMLDRLPGYIIPVPFLGRDGKRYILPANRVSPEEQANREQIALELNDRGLSLRAIGELVGVSHEQVRRYLSRADNGARDTCTGMDGKTYRIRKEVTE